MAKNIGLARASKATRRRVARKGGLLRWRKKQKKGAIMSKKTFEKIRRQAERKYGKKRAMKIAGSAYWKTARAKYRK